MIDDKIRKSVRLPAKDLNILTSLFREMFSPDDKLYIFGSRTNLQKKGGDIDLYIETSIKDIDRALDIKSKFSWELQKNIGEQKIDIVINFTILNHDLPIYTTAKNQGVQIV